MSSGRRPKPTALKRREGNPGKRPLPELEPIPPSTIADPPAHLSTYAREEWDRIAPGLETMGMLSMVDQGALGAYCTAYGRWRQAEEQILALTSRKKFQLVVAAVSGQLMPHPLIGVSNKAAADMIRYAVEFGFTPSARARLGIDIQKLHKGKFDGLIGGKSSER